MARTSTLDTPATEVLEKMREETAAILSAAPEAYSKADEEAIANQAATAYEAPDEMDTDPEDLTFLIEMAAKQMGRPIPQAALDKMRHSLRPVVADKAGEPVKEVLSFDEYQRKQRALRQEVRETQPTVGAKRARMMAAIKASPIVAYPNRTDRSLCLNGVLVEVPEGVVNIPVIIAKQIQEIESYEHALAREIERAKRIMNIDAPRSSFINKRVNRFTIN